MKYTYAYRFFFENPRWVTNLLAVAICFLVPILGPMVFLGYAFEIVESLHHRRGSRYPDFDTSRLMDYLMRGIWPFLAQLVVGVPLGMIGGFFYVLFWIAVGVAPDKYRAVVLCIVLPLLFLAIVLLVIVATLVLVPITLRAGLSQDFGKAFSLAFVKDFMKRVWRETILQELFRIGSGILVGLAGMMLCCIGVYPAQALIAVAQIHLMYQLYELYLERGGTPIPLKETPTMPNDLGSIPTAEAAPESFKAADE